jgi:YD repeat-containing protein
MRTAKLIQDDWNITYQWNDRHQLTEMNLNRRFENGPVEIKLLFETGNE